MLANSEWNHYPMLHWLPLEHSTIVSPRYFLVQAVGFGQRLTVFCLKSFRVTALIGSGIHLPHSLPLAILLSECDGR